ncbi:MAG: hypothetical protein RR365_06395 [Bacteroides sp.]
MKRNKAKIGWKPLLIIGFALMAVQLLPIIGNAKVGGNPWDSDAFLAGNAAQVMYDVATLIGYCVLGITGLVLVLVAISRRRQREPIAVTASEHNDEQLLSIGTPVDKNTWKHGALPVLACAAFALLLSTIYFGCSTIVLRNEITELIETVAKKDAELDEQETAIANAVAARDEEWNLWASLVREELNGQAITVPAPQGTMDIGELNALVDKVRDGEIGGVPSESECPELYLTIAKMFRSTDHFSIYKYLSAIYHFETDKYPLEYFKEKGFTYTGDEIEEWEP